MTAALNLFADVPSDGWRKSSFSGGGTGSNCVEVAATGDTVFLRDSKNPDGAVLRIPSTEMDAFLQAIKAGEFDDLQ